MILVNGVISNFVPANDRGLAYGDGVFRTLLVRNGRPQHWSQHYAKLNADCAALKIECPLEPVLGGEVARATQHNPDCVLKIIITRGAGQRGYAPPLKALPTRVVMALPLPQYPPEFSLTGVVALFCKTCLSRQPALAGVKHLNRLENVLARAEWSDSAIAEGLMLDTEGNVIGGTMSNLFIVERNVLVSPELAHCGVAGVTRARLIQAAAVHGVICLTEHISRERLLQCEEILLVNSIIGVWQVRQINNRKWLPGMVTPQVRAWLNVDDR